MEFVWEIVAVLVILACVAIIAEVVNLIMNRRKIDPKVGRISFRESMDLVELPIVTFMNNGRKLNFLLDTGASYSSINEAALEGLSYVDTGETGFGIGIEGTVKEDRGYIRMDVGYRSQSYEDDFQVVDLSQAFGMIKQECGINLHGILGSTFFQKYRYVLNFDELVAYSMV
ncbi:aspartyl protease [Bacteroides phage PhiCrAssBcn5]|nr:aspartyl protease [Bacteroides phage PhiCrAssBcn4]WCF57021.1 aspartyl protease [Bacteroides phage PhiCrAssBcn9]WCF57675.1 aspartyl protease [Bacteroides phage PhiCrAssBcn5]WCF57840.1 aspartyl protease [Bacteroides phage PhiCrAssBcn6]WCF57954.1 aspartyl protease [Bacteroides phage PhiCrAssBcn7]WCF57974.1 aspartyl protease [Bacteroides phage PhiCrAssBcn8]WCF58104.1 aspartyl protease [Bacteroides phage PhiCrAssBcn10]WCF58245.1 aspartyl protease [Bacteroides phage PhiCrAssBcn11]WCF58348.1 as